MSLNPRDCVKIRKEIDSWRAEALIGDDLAQKLLERYTLRAAGSGHISAIITMGSVLIGVGVLLFVGSNWAALTATIRLAIIVAAMLAFYILGWILGFEPGKRPRVGSGLMLVGSVIFGAGIWQVAQMFNLGIELSDGIILWGAGVAAVALVTRSSTQSVLFALLSVPWAVLNGAEWHFSEDPLTLTLRLLVAFAVTTGLCFFTRSKSGIAVSIGLTTLTFAIASLAEPKQFDALPWGACLFAFYLVMKKEWSGAAAAFMYGGAVAMIFGLLHATFCYESAFSSLGTHLVLVLPAIVLSAVVALMRAQYKWEALGLALITALPIISLLSPNETIYRLLTNIILVASLVAAMWSAQGRLREPGLINLAIAAFVLEVIFRYFDFFFSMLDRSMAFTIGGIILVVGGAIAERGRRKLLERIS
jgi:uncharacterized membrane protein